MLNSKGIVMTCNFIEGEGNEFLQAMGSLESWIVCLKCF